MVRNKFAGFRFGSIGKRHWSADSDPNQIVTDPQHRVQLLVNVKYVHIIIWNVYFDSRSNPDPVKSFGSLRIRIRNTGQNGTGSMIRSLNKEFWYFYPKLLFLSLRNYYNQGCSSLIPDLDLNFTHPVSWIQGQKGIGCLIRICITVFSFVSCLTYILVCFTEILKNLCLICLYQFAIFFTWELN
jgi:hypothetical protein